MTIIQGITILVLCASFLSIGVSLGKKVMSINYGGPPPARTGGGLGPVIEIDFSSSPELAEIFASWIESGDYITAFAEWCTERENAR